MRVVILAGGRGTRLAPLTSVLPKPLMPIGDRSIIEILLERLSHAGFRDITLSVGYLSHLIQAVLSNGAHDAAIAYVREPNPLGTAGPLRLIDALDETFLVMNGDVLTNLDYHDIVEEHRSAGNVLTIAVHERTMRMDYGVLHLARSRETTHRVTAYEEKPEIPLIVSMGIYVLEPHVLEFIPPDQPFDFPDLVHALLAADEPVGAFPFDGFWLDIGRHEDYEEAVQVWESSDNHFLR
jgi:NDP-sugar pyrophosphorylase family protein